LSKPLALAATLIAAKARVGVAVRATGLGLGTTSSTTTMITSSPRVGID
jgi:hypothetical protein